MQREENDRINVFSKLATAEKVDNI